MRTFNVKKKLLSLTMSKEKKIELYRHDTDESNKINKLYANKENWQTITTYLDELHDEAVKKLTHRNLSNEDLQWCNHRISLVAEFYKKLETKRKQGEMALQKLKEMEDVR